ncbi:MAG: hypothetical protein Q7T70_12190 [Polaromonas sp.]|nr:hypothetical protein [Polaromonas sp.]RYF42079.1 MAG: hypothetical protein EOO25_07865 [Comamonadaceae bacterium]
MQEQFPIPPKLLEALRRGSLRENLKLLREIGVRGREGRHYLWEAFKAGRLRGPDTAQLPGDPSLSPGQVGGGGGSLWWIAVLVAIAAAAAYFWMR